MTGPGVRRAVGSVLSGAGVLAVIGALHLLGAGSLATPPLASAADLQSWATDRGPIAVGMVVVRLVALGVGYHLIVTTTLAVLGRILRWPGLVRLAEASTLPPLRGTFRRLAGLGLSASAILTTPLPPVGARPAGTATLTLAEDHSGRSASLERIEARRTGPSGTASLRLVPGPGPASGSGKATLRPSADPVPDDPTPRAGNYVVAAGDHLWAIAEDRVAAHLGRQPSDAEVDRYWRALVAANPQLVDPDLLFPGDQLLVPPVKPGRATMRIDPTG